MAGKLLKEIKQTKPIDGPEDEAFLNILRTADSLAYDLGELLKPRGLSPASYNVLRILRGAGDAGLTCGEVGDRMLTRVPDVTRVLDRLEDRQLVKRSRERKDRRVVRTYVTVAGLDLLADLDKPVIQLHRAQLAHLGKRRLNELIDLLEAVRDHRDEETALTREF